MILDNKTILVTGGTGSFGQKFIEYILNNKNPKSIRIFSRDEMKQWEMKRKFDSNKKLRFFIGDVRDKNRLMRAFEGVDIVVHAAALKHVPVCEYNPFEAVLTNTIGVQNIIEAALFNNVDKIMAISTDKAVDPVNLYGATKMCMEKICTAANVYSGKNRRTKISCVRYGNVFGSRGSILPLWNEQKKNGYITITDKRMTRFWLTLDQGIEFVINSIELMEGGEVFVPKISSMKVIDLSKVVAPNCEVRVIGIRPGEKLHECLITENEARNTYEMENYFVVIPKGDGYTSPLALKGKSLPDNFKYTSNENNKWLSPDQILKILKRKSSHMVVS